MVTRRKREKLEARAADELVTKLNRRPKEVLLAKKTAYLVVFPTNNSGTATPTKLLLYVKESRASVFGLLQETKAKREAIDAWMNQAVVGDVLTDEKCKWMLTLVSTEQSVIKTLMDVPVEPVYTTVTMYSKRGKFNG